MYSCSWGPAISFLHVLFQQSLNRKFSKLGEEKANGFFQLRNVLYSTMFSLLLPSLHHRYFLSLSLPLFQDSKPRWSLNENNSSGSLSNIFHYFVMRKSYIKSTHYAFLLVFLLFFVSIYS